VTEQECDTAQLPRSWALARLGELAKEINPGFPSGRWQRNDGKGALHFRPMNIDIDGKVDLTDAKYVQKEDYDVLRKGDVLFNNTNSPKLLGKTTYFKNDTNWAYSNHMTRIRFFPDSLEPGFIAYYLHYLFRNGFFMTKCVHHVNQASISSSFLAQNVCVPLPALAEQSRIVSRIEELFTRLDAGVEGLRKVKTQLKRYRQAVLKYAFEGKLTEEWRKTHKNQIEPATKLLERIKQERRKDPKHKELPPINIADLPETPENWTWTRLGEIGIVASGGTPSTKIPEYFDGDVPWITPADLSDFTGKFIHRGRRNISEKGLNSSSAVLLPEGTILFSSRAPIGYVAIAANSVSTNQGFKNLILYKGIFNEYIFYYLKASKILAESYGSGTTFREVSAARFSLIPIPLAPLNEQHRIVEEIEQRLSLMNETQKTIAQAMKQSDRLRQSILKIAFEGRLVPQDPSDEPAEKLLDRIKDERAKSKGEKDINKKKIKPKQLELSTYVK
jgi:type I restriction enzyme S subunit